MDVQVAKKLGLKTVRSGTVHGAGAGDVPVEYVDSVTFELTGLQCSVAMHFPQPDFWASARLYWISIFRLANRATT